MQVERDQHRLQRPVQPFWKTHVAMGDRGGGERRDGMTRHDNRGDVERQHRQPLDRSGDQVFDGVVTH